MRYRLLWLTALLVAPLLHVPLAAAQPAVHPPHAAVHADTVVQALLSRAQAAFDKGDYLTAKALFTQATVVAPKNAVAWAGKARSEDWLDDYTDAVTDYTVAIQYAPTNELYYVRRGLCYDHMGDAPHALADYTAAIHVAPDDAAAYQDRGAFYNNHGEYAPAVADYTQAIRLRPTWWSAYDDRAESELSLGLDQAAIKDFTSYIKHTAQFDCGCAYTDRGVAYSNLHEYAKSLADCKKAIVIGTPGNPEFYNCGTASYHLGKYASAISYLTQALLFNPDDGMAYYFRGLARRDSSDKPGAITDEQQAVRIFTAQGNSAYARQVEALLQQLQATS